MRTLYRQVRLVAIWRRPKLTARGDPDHDHVVAGIAARLIELPRRAVVLAEDETHLNLLPHVRASWTLRTARPQIPTPCSNRQVTVFGAIEVTTGAWVYRLGRRRAADFIALLDQLKRGELRERRHASPTETPQLRDTAPIPTGNPQTKRHTQVHL